MTSTEEQLATVIVYAAFGGAYGVSGYTKHVAEGDKEIKPKKFAKTLMIGAIAGAVVASRGEEFGAGAFESAMVIAIPVGDQLWAAGARLWRQATAGSSR